ncbi:MAG: DUF4136 domain-containing protein [Pseudomonadota bacterium]
MSLRHLLTLGGLVTLLAACSSNPPVIDYDSSIDFSGYKSYAFISEHPLMRAPGSPPGSPLLEGKLIRATDMVLQAKGMTKVDDPEGADFAIGFTVGSRDKIRVNSYPEPYRPYYGTWGWGGPYYAGSNNVDVQQYTEGTLAIDIYDVNEHKPAWHGTATKRITDSMRRNPDESVNGFVTEILSGFPPGSMAAN